MLKKNRKGGAGGAGGAATADTRATKLRNNRKGQYEIKAQEDPFLRGLSASEKQVPQFIDLHKFVSSRAHELRHFTNILKAKISTKMEV